MFKKICINAALLLAAAHLSFAAVEYTVTDIGTLPGDNIFGTHPTAINSRGQITGDSAIDSANSVVHAFLYTPGASALQDLGTLGGAYSYGTAINDNGVVVGTGNSKNSIAPQGFIAFDGFIAGTGSLGGIDSFALGINNAGQVTGYAETFNNNVFHAYIREKNGTFDEFSSAFFTGGGTNGYGQAINQIGEIVGYAQIPGDTYQHAFYLLASGFGVDLTFGLNADSAAFALNNTPNNPLIVGSTGTQDDASERAVRFTGGGAATPLGELIPNGRSRALAVNDAGTIVGFAAVASGTHAFIYRTQDASPVMIDLNDLIAPGGTVTLTSATGINASGQICAVGKDSATPGQYDRAYLVSPIVAPTPTPTPAPAAPKVTISGKKSFKTAKASIPVKGTATGTVTSVTYKVGKKSGKASGTSAWKFTAKLKPGKNVITVSATGPGGTSSAKITVSRTK